MPHTSRFSRSASSPRSLLPMILLAALMVGSCSGDDSDSDSESKSSSSTSKSSSSSSSSKAEYTLPEPVEDGDPAVEPAATVVADDSGIPGVVAYDSSGWPKSSGQPTPTALPHGHVPGPVEYSVTPPVGGNHNPVWMNCGVYPEPVPSERAVHNLEHGAVWITYRPDLAEADIEALRAFVRKQPTVRVADGDSTVDTEQRFIDLSPFPGLPAQIVITAWAHQLRVDSPTDARLQRFVDTFRVSQKYSPEYGASCGHQPPKIGGVPEFS